MIALAPAHPEPVEGPARARPRFALPRPWTLLSLAAAFHFAERIVAGVSHCAAAGSCPW